MSQSLYKLYYQFNDSSGTMIDHVTVENPGSEAIAPQIGERLNVLHPNPEPGSTNMISSRGEVASVHHAINVDGSDKATQQITFVCKDSQSDEWP